MADLIEPGKAEAEDAGQHPLVRFLGAIATTGVSACVSNLEARLFALRSGDVVLPVVAGVNGGGKCYVATFTRMYMDGAADELAGSKNAVLRLIAPAVSLAGPIARTLGFDHIVTVNNYLHPTSHVADWSSLDAKAMTDLVISRFPDRAIWVRGLTDALHAAELERLRTLGYVIAPSRPVDIADPRRPDWKIKHNLRNDLNRLTRLPGFTPFVGGAFSDADFVEMERLCRAATVIRHGALMPQYTPAFFRACTSWPECVFVGLRDDSGRLRGFATIVVDEQAITTGTIGHDVDDESAKPVYPSLIALMMRESIQARKPFNIGYGAAQLKRQRGTRPAIEYNAFYLRHLPRMRRALWGTATSAISNFAGSVMERL